MKRLIKTIGASIVRWWKAVRRYLRKGISEDHQEHHVAQGEASKMEPPRLLSNDPGMPPKDYGIYLLRSGKYYQNLMRRKLLSKR